MGKQKLASDFIKQLISKPNKLVDKNAVPKSFIRPTQIVSKQSTNNSPEPLE